jgi:hypothetical protein
MSQASSAAMDAVLSPPKPRARTPITPPPPPNPEVFEVMEFCGRYRVSRSIAFKEIAAGRLIARRVGRKSLITLDAARDWLNHLPTTREA